MAPPRSPQDKKAAELERDRRNTYGENDKSSRRAIRQRKRLASRLFRQAFRQALHRSDAVEGETPAVPRARGRWRKCADTPLGELLHGRRMRRLEREVRRRLAADPTFLDRLELAAVGDGGFAELEARMIVRSLRAGILGYDRHHPDIADADIDRLQALLRRLR